MPKFPKIADRKIGDADAGLLARLDEPFTAEAVFDRLPDVAYFVKNARAEYVIVNRTLAERCGAREKRTILGRTAADVFPPPFGRSFYEQDLRILATGKSLLNELEMHLYPSGSTGWCLTDKFPLRAGGQVVGLVGVSQDLHSPNAEAAEYDRVAQSVGYARSHLGDPLSTRQLAAVAGLTSYQLDQRVRRLFHLTTGQLILKLRMDVAALLLRDTDQPMAAVAQRCGYADQSAFSRQFRRTTGVTPGEYRRFLRPRGGDAL